MREVQFGTWLEQTYRTKDGKRLQVRPRSDAKSRCNRIERDEGDLDKHFVRDGMKSLIGLLTYSRGDERAGIPAQHRITIDGDEVRGTSSLRSAANLYRLFCLDHPPKKQSPKSVAR